MGVLDGRVAICTGSGRGVGAEVAKLMAKEGASVIVNDPGVSGGGDGGGQGPAEAIANEIKDGALSEADAIAEARQLITQATAEGAAAAAEVAEANGEY